MTATRLIKAIARRATMPRTRQWLRARAAGEAFVPPVGFARHGDLRRPAPFSRNWGEERGGPLDRHYIEQFLEAHAADVRGRVLEVGDADQTRAYGGGRVTRSDVLNLRPGDPQTTIVDDLATGEHLPSDAFDCVLLTQTLQLIYEVRGAVATVHRILKPGGVALVTAPGITPVNRHDRDSWGDHWFWNFSTLSLRKLFEERFDAADVAVRSYGNVLAASGFLYGLGRGDLKPWELDVRDPDYEMLITLRARKGGGGVA